MRTEAGKPMKITQDGFDTGEIFAHYIDWRAENPSDDIMTELLNVEFEDETATTRRLSRDELLLYVNVVAGAGNETTTRLIGWAGKVLAEHPDQRRELANDKSSYPTGQSRSCCGTSRPPHMSRGTSVATSSTTAGRCRRAASC